jgi:hypothetical protein
MSMGGAISTAWSRDSLARLSAAGKRCTGVNLPLSYLVRNRAEEIEHHLHGPANSNLVADGEEVACPAEHDARATMAYFGLAEEQVDATFTSFE